MTTVAPMGRVGRWIAALALAAGCPAGDLSAGEPDFLRPVEAGGSLRVLALGGAFVGLGDDVGTTAANPAGLATVPRSFEVVVAPQGTGPGGRPRHAALALHPRPWLATGLGWQQDARQSMVPTAGGPRLDGASGMVFLGAALTLPDHRYSLGITSEWRRLSYQDASVKGHRTDLGWTAGLLFRPESREAPRLGAAYSTASDWVLADGRLVRMPPVLSAGVSWNYRLLRFSDFLLSLETDWVRYSDFTRDAPPDRQARDDLDLRFGMELSFPRDCFTGCGTLLQIRGGIHNAAPLPFDVVGASPSEGLGQGPPRSSRLSAGLSFSWRRVLQGRLKLEATYDRRSRSLSFGLGWRFPEAYRAGIEDRTRR